VGGEGESEFSSGWEDGQLVLQEGGGGRAGSSWMDAKQPGCVWETSREEL
jgi:hypothetical protein